MLAAAMAATALAAAPLTRSSAEGGLPCVVVTSTTDAGAGSLRNAIACASSGDTITFDASFNTPQTITLTSGALEIAKTLVISGPGASLLTISAGSASQVLLVSDNADLYGMTLRDGYSGGNGGAIYVSSGTLTLSNTQVLSSSAGAYGGGFFSVGAATLINSEVLTNTAANGGGFWSQGNVSITGTTIASNTAAERAGGFHSDVNIVVVDSTIERNVAGSSEGGFGAAGTTWISDTLITRNTAGAYGGGFYSAGAATLINSEVSTNTAANGGGF